MITCFVYIVFSVNTAHNVHNEYNVYKVHIILKTSSVDVIQSHHDIHHQGKAGRGGKE